MADPNPSGNQPIHLLIGADLYGSLLLGELRQGPFGIPTAQGTALGWILSGPTGTADRADSNALALHCIQESDLTFSLRKFWKEEEIPSVIPLSEEDDKCERHFATTHSRSPNGRYIIRLPFK